MYNCIHVQVRIIAQIFLMMRSDQTGIEVLAIVLHMRHLDTNIESLRPTQTSKPDMLEVVWQEYDEILRANTLTLGFWEVWTSKICSSSNLLLESNLLLRRSSFLKALARTSRIQMPWPSPRSGAMRGG